jgi:hypothetical protein
MRALRRSWNSKPSYIDMLTLEVAFFQNLTRDNCEYGGIGLDSKRPFGNSFVEGDILEMLNATKTGDNGDGPCWSSAQLDYATRMYDSLVPFLHSRHLTTKQRKDIPSYLKKEWEGQ